MGVLRNIAERFAAVCGLPERVKEPGPSPLDLARAHRGSAWASYDAAASARDTRAMHAAVKHFRAATAEVVRLELAEARQFRPAMMEKH